MKIEEIKKLSEEFLEQHQPLDEEQAYKSIRAFIQFLEAKFCTYMVKDVDKKEIYGHYHCNKCKCSMIPKNRLRWKVKDGVSCIHVCPKCSNIFIEKEY